MSELLESVNRIVAHFTQAKKAFEERGNRDKAIEMAQHEAMLRSFVREYERLEQLTRPIPMSNGDDLSDLPKELLAELSITKSDELENQIITVINACDRYADIDTILINLFRKFKVKQTRRYLQNKLWRMVQKEMLWSVSGKKGSYSTAPQLPELSNDTPPETDLNDDIPF